MSKDNQNGSVDLLADAMRKVFSEAVSDAVEPLNVAVGKLISEVGEIRADMGHMERRLTAKLKADLTIPNELMQAKLAQQLKDISSDVRTALKKSD